VAEDTGTGDGAGGTILRTWHLRNTGTTACLLTGQLDSVSGVRQGQRQQITLHAPPPSGFAGDVVPVVLRPGDTGIAPFNFSPRCDTGPYPPPATTTFTDIRLGFAGGSLDVPGAASRIDLGCHVADGLNAGPVGGSQQTPHYADQPVSHLQFRIAAPPTVQAGTDLDYVLTISNATGTDIALEPCPSYVQSSTDVKDHYQLNCARSRPVPAQGMETFAMRLHIPSNADTGPTKLGWALDAVFDARPPITAVADITVEGGTDPRVGHIDCTPQAEQAPCTSMEMGKRYEFLLTTHCGLRSLYANSQYWVLRDSNTVTTGAPRGYDDPQDAGTVTLMKPTYLEHLSRQGVASAWTPDAAPRRQCQARTS
jgi:hypothetical protein